MHCSSKKSKPNKMFILKTYFKANKNKMDQLESNLDSLTFQQAQTFQNELSTKNYYERI